MSEPVPAALPAAKQATVTRLVSALAQAPGVVAVVLGGSYASGLAKATSDVDLGLYYRPDAPFSVETIRQIAQEVAVEPPTVTGFYEWGAWVNGGAWIPTASGKVDFLYRNLDQVERAIGEAEQGIVHHDYPQQPPYGFYSVIYLAETEICRPLFDPTGAIQALKERVRVYPDALRERLVSDNLWSAEFTLLHARSFAAQGDVYNTAGCLARVAANLTQVLFALNRRYFISDKRAMAEIDGFATRPAAYVGTLARILAAPGSTAQALTQTVQATEKLWQQVVDLTVGGYSPRFVVP